MLYSEDNVRAIQQLLCAMVCRIGHVNTGLLLLYTYLYWFDLYFCIHANK